MKRTRFALSVLILTTFIYEATQIRYRGQTHPFSLRNYLIIGIAVAFAVLIHESRQKGTSPAAYRKSLLFGASDRPGRIVYMDYLRVLAAVLVIAVHVMEPTYQSLTPLSPAWTLLALLTSIALCCNLLFMMLSGALLLQNSEESLTGFYVKRALKVLLPFFAYYLFYQYYVFGISILLPSNWFSLLQEFLSNESGRTPHFWLVYVILSFYAAAPFLAVMVKHLPERMLAGLTAVCLFLHAVFTYAPCLRLNFVLVPFLASWDAIFLLGYFCTTQTALKHYRRFMAGGVLSVLFAAAAINTTDSFPALLYNNAPPVMLISCAVFLFFRRHGDGLFSRIPAFLSVIGRYSFSILLIHWFVLFEIVEGRLGINGFSFGIIGGTIASILLTLLISLVFAIVYDNTVVLCLDWLVRALLRAGARLLRQSKKEDQASA